MKNKLKKTLYCAGALLTVALAAFFFDRFFIRYYKTETEPKSLALASAFCREILSGKQEAHERAAKMMGSAAQKLISDKRAFVKKLSEELRKRGAGPDCEIKFFTSQAWIKNPYLERPSERAYERRVFAVFCSLNKTEIHELTTRQPTLMIGITDGKPDLPMEVF